MKMPTPSPSPAARETSGPDPGPEFTARRSQMSQRPSTRYHRVTKETPNMTGLGGGCHSVEHISQWIHSSQVKVEKHI